MDSGNSSSIQSSSAGDEEYDSRAEPISSFLNPRNSLTFTSLPRQHHQSPAPASSLEPLATYLDAFGRLPAPDANSHPILNLDMPWAARGQSSSDHPSCTDVGGTLVSASPSHTSIPDPLMGRLSRGPHGGGGDSITNPLPSPSNSSTQQPLAAPPPHQPPKAAAPSRGSKKRSRASRRAPTTVLTTDTSNFRAMVQEFTGIPSPPFPSMGFPRPRLDLFHAATSPAGGSPAIPDAGPHYLLRPFAQRVTVPSFGSSLASSSAPLTIVDHVGSAGSVTATAAAARSTNSYTFITRPIASNTTTSATSICDSYPLPSDLRIGNQQQNLLNLFNIQSLTQPSSSIKYNSVDVPCLGTEKAPKEPPPPMPPPASAARYAIGGVPNHGHAHVHLGNRPSLTPSEGASPLRGGGGDTGGDEAARWLDGSAGTDSGDRRQFMAAGASSGDLRRRGNSWKLNCTSSAPPEYPAVNGSENASARGEVLR
uniref:VQ domain-containing protein n=1 Tax=Anthurium amnicola TaxID=1678845 RepID=A0A1D1Y0P9_9ARAE